jgi:hypothetical protein
MRYSFHRLAVDYLITPVGDAPHLAGGAYTIIGHRYAITETFIPGRYDVQPSPVFKGDIPMKATAQQLTDLKAAGCDDATITKLSALPNINWTAILAIIGKLVAAGITLADILAALGL